MQRNTKNLILILISFCLCSVELFGQSQDSLFFDEGFEQVHLIPGDSLNTYWLVFENRGKRNPFDAMSLAQMIAEKNNVKITHYIPSFHGVPMGVYSPTEEGFKSEELHSYLKRDIGYRFSPSKYRFNFRINPDFQSRLGYFDDPFQYKLGIIIDSDFILARGLTFTTGIEIPLGNTLDNEQLNVRLAPTLFNYFYEPVDDHFLSLSAGILYNDRYGFDLQYRYRHSNMKWSFGVEYGITGYYYFPKEGLYWQGLDNEILIADIEYFIPNGGITLRAAAGQFIFGDRGIRMDLIKQYGRVDLGFFGARTHNGSNFGINLTIPLFPGKLLRNGKIEIRTSEEFRHEYFFNHNGTIARRYRTSYRLSQKLRQFNPRFIESQKRYNLN